ncbi:hypothetical protein ACOJBO_03760 [Rhizobium beringeri]
MLRHALNDDLRTPWRLLRISDWCSPNFTRHRHHHPIARSPVIFLEALNHAGYRQAS